MVVRHITQRYTKANMATCILSKELLHQACITSELCIHEWKSRKRNTCKEAWLTYIMIHHDNIVEGSGKSTWNATTWNASTISNKMATI